MQALHAHATINGYFFHNTNRSYFWEQTRTQVWDSNWFYLFINSYYTFPINDLAEDALSLKKATSSHPTNIPIDNLY